MRRLVHIPIIHAAEDLGSQIEAVRKAYMARYGIRAWQQHLRVVAQFWSEIRRLVLRFQRPGSLLRIYQDGLPVCERELELARELAGSGSENYRLLADLAGQGAVLMGTEDPDLLRQERRRWQEPASAFQPASSSSYDPLMEQRDRYIAARIDATLGPEPELGLLFIGALHRVTEKLPPGIEVVRLTGA
ncbi:MAG: hypothetical protein AAB225_03870 [Acidobacteriota bacterium]